MKFDIYTISLPEGAVSLASDPNKRNKSVSFDVIGTMKRYYKIKTSSVEDGSVAFPEKVRIITDAPAGTSIFGKHDGGYPQYLSLYEGSISRETHIKSKNGTSIENGTGSEWSFHDVWFKPSTKYILYMEKGEGYLYNAEGSALWEWTNDEILISFTTPSIEESGFPPLEFEQPKIGDYNDGPVLEEDHELASIDNLLMAIKGLEYKYNDTSYQLIVMPYADHNGYLYEITDGGDVLLKEITITTRLVSVSGVTYHMMNAIVNATFYEGKRYRIVIPEGVIAVYKQSFYNYVFNPEMSYNVRGTTPLEASVISCTVEDNAEVSELYNVVWAFNGEYELEPDATAKVEKINIKYPTWMTSKYTFPLELTVEKGVSYLLLNTTNPTTGRPFDISKLYYAGITIPAGILRHPTDESITNKEIVLSVLGSDATVAVQEPISVTVLLKEGAISSANDIESAPTIYSYTVEAVKDKKFTLDFTDSNWKLASLYRDGKDALNTVGDDGVYTTPALKENTVIAASLEYGDGSYITIDQTTGVVQLRGTKYLVRIEGSNIVISGLTGNETINVYNMAGIAVAETAVKPGTEIVRIGAQPGQYIVLVDKTPFKAIVR